MAVRPTAATLPVVPPEGADAGARPDRQGLRPVSPDDASGAVGRPTPTLEIEAATVLAGPVTRPGQTTPVVARPRPGANGVDTPAVALAAGVLVNVGVVGPLAEGPLRATVALPTVVDVDVGVVGVATADVGARRVPDPPDAVFLVAAIGHATADAHEVVARARPCVVETPSPTGAHAVTLDEEEVLASEVAVGDADVVARGARPRAPVLGLVRHRRGGLVVQVAARDAASRATTAAQVALAVPTLGPVGANDGGLAVPVTTARPAHAAHHDAAVLVGDVDRRDGAAVLLNPQEADRRPLDAATAVGPTAKAAHAAPDEGGLAEAATAFLVPAAGRVVPAVGPRH